MGITTQGPQHNSEECVDTLQGPHIVLPPARSVQGTNQQNMWENTPHTPQHVQPPQMVPPPRAWQNLPACSAEPTPAVAAVQPSTTQAPGAASVNSFPTQRADGLVCVTGQSSHAPPLREQMPPWD